MIAVAPVANAIEPSAVLRWEGASACELRALPATIPVAAKSASDASIRSVCTALRYRQLGSCRASHQFQAPELVLIPNTVATLPATSECWLRVEGVVLSSSVRPKRYSTPNKESIDEAGLDFTKTSRTHAGLPTRTSSQRVRRSHSARAASMRANASSRSRGLFQAVNASTLARSRLTQARKYSASRVDRIGRPPTVT